MPIYDHDGTTNYEIAKVYDYDGTSNNQISKIYDHDGTTNSLVYSAEMVVLDGDINLLGKPTYNWAEGDGWASTNSFAKQSDGSYMLKMSIGSNGWRNWTVNFPNKITNDGYTKIKLVYTVTTWSNVSSVSFNTSGTTTNRINGTLNVEQVITKDISNISSLSIYFGGSFDAGGNFAAKIRIYLE